MESLKDELIENAKNKFEEIKDVDPEAANRLRVFIQELEGKE